MSNQASKLLVGLTRINSNQEIAALLNFENFIKKTSSVVTYHIGITLGATKDWRRNSPLNNDALKKCTLFSDLEIVFRITF